jgi:hypothetical protein
MIDALILNDITVISGNPIKTGLGLTSILFDILFILQHYVWFADDNGSRQPPQHPNEEEIAVEDQPLLGPEN